MLRYQDNERHRKKLLNRFANSNAFRDVFYLTPEIKEYIVQHTLPITNEILQKGKEIKKTKKQTYRQRPEVKAQRKAYQQRPEVKAQNKAYMQRPEVKARNREYQRKYRNSPEGREKRKQEKKRARERKREPSENHNSNNTP